MSGIKLLIIFGAIAFFMFGCCSLTGDTSTPYTPSANSNSPSQPSQQTQPVNNQNDLSGQTYAALVALGVPLECDITTMHEGELTTMKLYMNGEQEMRTEIDGYDVDCEKMIYIAKGNTFYIGCENGFIFDDCVWYSVTSQQSSTGSDPYSYDSTSSSPDFSNVPASEINCKPWLYDSSKFVPTGKVCDMAALMNMTMYS